MSGSARDAVTDGSHLPRLDIDVGGDVQALRVAIEDASGSFAIVAIDAADGDDRRALIAPPSRAAVLRSAHGPGR